MALLSGDSLAVGLAAFIHHVKVDARIGRRSAEGAAHIRRYPDKTVYVSLGANDSDSPAAARAFKRRVKLVVGGRDCVAWLSVPLHPRLNRMLAEVPGARVVSIAGVNRRDGTHPDAEGYRVLARRMKAACPPPTRGAGGIPSIAPPLPATVPSVPSIPLPSLPPLPAPPLLP